VHEYDLNSIEFLHHCYKFQLEQVQVVGNQGNQGNAIGNQNNDVKLGQNQINANNTLGKVFSQHNNNNNNNNAGGSSGNSSGDKNSIINDNSNSTLTASNSTQNIQNNNQKLVKSNLKVVEFIAYLRAAMYPHLTGFETELVKYGMVDLHLLVEELLTLSPDTITQLCQDYSGNYDDNSNNGGVNFIGFTHRK
jgi:hypothetical protein